MTQYSSEQAVFHTEELAFAESELKVALMFADLSLSAYRIGRLKRACDARSKAESLCTKATARLNHLENRERADQILRELVDRLASLPQGKTLTRAAG